MRHADRTTYRVIVELAHQSAEFAFAPDDLKLAVGPDHCYSCAVVTSVFKPGKPV
jgi:hypothetical protein